MVFLFVLVRVIAIVMVRLPILVIVIVVVVFVSVMLVFQFVVVLVVVLLFVTGMSESIHKEGSEADEEEDLLGEHCANRFVLKPFSAKPTSDFCAFLRCHISIFLYIKVSTRLTYTYSNLRSQGRAREL